MPKPRTLPLFDPSPTDEAAGVSPEERILLHLLPDMGQPTPKRPLQCVTYKQALPEYLRMKEVSNRWLLSYSDLLRLGVFRLVQALENPSEELKELLIAHRRMEEEKRLARALKRQPRLKLVKTG